MINKKNNLSKLLKLPSLNSNSLKPLKKFSMIRDRTLADHMLRSKTGRNTYPNLLILKFSHSLLMEMTIILELLSGILSSKNQHSTSIIQLLEMREKQDKSYKADMMTYSVRHGDHLFNQEEIYLTGHAKPKMNH